MAAGRSLAAALAWMASAMRPATDGSPRWKKSTLGRAVADFRSLGQCVRQRPRVRRHRWIQDLHAPHFLDHDAGARGDIDTETALGAANGGHDLRNDFGNHQPPELAGAERFVKKQAALDGAEAEADECLLGR